MTALLYCPQCQLFNLGSPNSGRWHCSANEDASVSSPPYRALIYSPVAFNQRTNAYMSLDLSGLLDVLRESPSYRQLLKELLQSSSNTEYNIVSSARPFLLAALARDWHGPDHLSYVCRTPCLQRQRTAAHLAGVQRAPLSLRRAFRAFLRSRALGRERHPQQNQNLDRAGKPADGRQSHHRGIRARFDAGDAAARRLPGSHARTQDRRAASDGGAHPALDRHGLRTGDPRH